jgi:hypothetical protein
MSQVTINGTTYTNPEQGTTPPWGDDLHDLIEAIVTSLNSVVGSADILLTNFNIANNQAVAANVVGASFDTSQVRSAIISYSISRSTSSSELVECGQIYINYKNSTGTWDLAQNYGGSSGVTFTITNGGQLQYVSSNMSGTSYVGKMKFSAKSFLQT